LYSTREMRFAGMRELSRLATPQAYTAIGSYVAAGTLEMPFFPEDPRVKTGRIGVLSASIV
jgi:hypothetical protein